MTTLDDVVAALSEQAGWAQVTTPSDISVNGYAGKTFQRTAPADFAGCNPGDAAFKSWGGSWYEPNEIETLRVFDVNGSIIVVNARLKPDHQDASAVAGARRRARLDPHRRGMSAAPHTAHSPTPTQFVAADIPLIRRPRPARSRAGAAC